MSLAITAPVTSSVAAKSIVRAESLVDVTDAGSVQAEAVARPTPTKCPSWAMVVSDQRTAGELTEVSGIVGSRLVPDMWWVHNDSGDSPRALLIDGTLAVRAEVKLDILFALDVEDIAIDAEGIVWLADVGDNLKFRPTVHLYGFPETTSSATIAPRKVEITYPDRPHDVETLLIDPRSGDAFLIDKGVTGGRSTVFRVAANVLRSGGSATAETVGFIDVSGGGTIGPTAGDISPDGSMIVVKTLTTTYLWPRLRNQSIAETFASTPIAPCTIEGAGTNEAIGFDRDARRVVALAEGLGTPLRTLTKTL